MEKSIVKIIGGFISKDSNSRFMPLFKKLYEQQKNCLSGFSFYYFEGDVFVMKKETKRLLGFAGKNTLPYFSDPYGGVEGAFAVMGDKVIYSKNSVNVNDTWNSYRFINPNETYATNMDLKDLLTDFNDSGFKFHLSQNLGHESLIKPNQIMLSEEITFNTLLENYLKI